MLIFFFFFFSSRRRHTRWNCDWSSDVCSSDLDERYWLKGMKTFQATDPGLGPGGEVSSRDHPFQTFQWADYSAKPEHDYSYKVIPLNGAPAQLREGAHLAVRITTEAEVGTTHSVYFNRGAVASQEYARRF